MIKNFFTDTLLIIIVIIIIIIITTYKITKYSMFFHVLIYERVPWKNLGNHEQPTNSCNCTEK